MPATVQSTVMAMKSQAGVHQHLKELASQLFSEITSGNKSATYHPASKKSTKRYSTKPGQSNGTGGGSIGHVGDGSKKYSHLLCFCCPGHNPQERKLASSPIRGIIFNFLCSYFFHVNSFMYCHYNPKHLAISKIRHRA
jgi:hypothetical protein